MKSRFTHPLSSNWAWTTARVAAVARRNFMRRREKGVGSVYGETMLGVTVEGYKRVPNFVLYSLP